MMQQWTRKESPRGTRTTFPFQLHALLTKAELLGLNKVISWLPSGDKFVILKPNDFAQRILPKVFRQTKFSSFKRQLNAYGFQREITSHLELDKLVYYNDKFHRDNPTACGQISRRRTGDSLKASTKPRSQGFMDPGNSSSDSSSENFQTVKAASSFSGQQGHTAIRSELLREIVSSPGNSQSMTPRYFQPQMNFPEATLVGSISTEPQYARPIKPDARNEQIELSSSDLSKLLPSGHNDSILDELAESVADEETKNSFGKWDPQVEESLSRLPDESHQQGGESWISGVSDE
jgi:hypothetical protein